MKKSSRHILMLIRIALTFSILSSVSGQEPLSFREISVRSTNVTLTWNTTSPFFQIAQTASLSSPEWLRTVVTTNREVTFPLTQRAAFFRVIADSTPPKPIAPIAPQRRLDLLEAINEKIASLPGDDPSADSSEVLKFLLTLPEIDQAAMTPDTSLWAILTDGHPLLIFNNRLTSTNNRPGPLPTRKDSLRELVRNPEGNGENLKSPAVDFHSLSSPARTPTGIPASQRAVLLKATLPDINAPVLDYLVPAFKNRQYNVVGGEASLQALIDVKNVGNDIGVFYVDTHGGVGKLPTITINRTTGDWFYSYEDVYALASSTVVNETTQALYQESYDNYEILAGLLGSRVLKSLRREGKTDEIKNLKYFCILPRFVNRYWRFGQNSFVYVDTCHSGSEGAKSFIGACLASGAASYAGWSKAVQDGAALQTTQILFDALLGGSEIIKIQPAQRPFNRKLVIDYLVRSGFDTDPDPLPKGGAKLTFYQNALAVGSEFGALAPSIQSMNVDEKTGELRITGSFDPNVPATVRIQGNGSKEIGATPIIISSAATQPDPAQIICSLPARNQPSAGNVTVIQRGRTSNTVPLSEWWVSGQLAKYFSIDITRPSATYDYILHLRTDLHPYRRLPYEVSSFLGNNAAAAEDSSCSLTDASGVYNDPNGIRTVEWKLVSGGPIPRLFDSAPTVNNTGFAGGVIFVSDGSVYLTVSAAVKDGMNIVEKTVSSITGNLVITTVPSNPFTRTFSGFGKNGTWERTSFAIPAGEGSNAGDSGLTSWQAATTSFSLSPTPTGYAE